MIPVNFWVIAGALVLSAAGAYIFLGPSDRPKRSRKGPLQGLPNLGKICFINAVLQALVACPSFVFWITNIADSVDKRLWQNYPLIKALLAVFHALKGNGEQCSAAAVMEALRFHKWQISDEEQDAHEFYHVLTTTIEEELVTETPILSLFEATKLQDEKFKQNGVTLKQRYAPSSNLYIMKNLSPTKGFLASELKCNSCNSKYPTRYDTFNSISLAIPTPNWTQLTLLDLLQKFISYELIQDVSCDICARNSLSSNYAVCLPKSKTSFLKQLSFSKLPRCLCIHIQRTIWLSNGLPVKSNEHVVFPEVLVMDSFVHRHCKTRKLAPAANGKHSKENLANNSSQSTEPVNELSISKSIAENAPGDNQENLADNCSQSTKPVNEIKLSISNSIVENALGAKQENLADNSSQSAKPLNEMKLSISDSIAENAPGAKQENLTDNSSQSAKQLSLSNSIAENASGAKQENLADNSSQSAKPVNKIKLSISNSIAEYSPGANQLRSHSFVFLLKAVIVHLGDVCSGHFITYRRGADSNLGDRKWFRISDTVVTEVTFTEVSQCCAYMLFYEKVN